MQGSVLVHSTDLLQGVLGFSEGATVAATLLIEEQQRFEARGRPRRIKVSVTLHY